MNDRAHVIIKGVATTVSVVLYVLGHTEQAIYLLVCAVAVEVEHQGRES
jgi:hypothetical protein